VASHIAIDWCNSYGLRPFLPFSERWYSLDVFNLYDLWLWAVLLVAAFAPVLASLVSSEIGARPGSGRGLAVFALLFFAGLGFWRYLMHERAVAVLESRLYQGVAPTRVAAFPSQGNPWRWRGLVETPAFYVLYDLDLHREFDPAEGRILYRPEPEPAEATAWEAARRTRDFEVFLEFARYPVRVFSPLGEPGGGQLVEVMDLRFGDPATPAFAATAEVGGDGRVRRSGFAFRPARLRRPPR
jgi:inner membrane protein